MEILIRLGNKENSDDFCEKLRIRCFIPSGSNEDSGNFTGESRMRIFILLGSKNSVGKKAYCRGVGSGVFGRLSLYWGIILGWGETKVNHYLVDFQLQDNLLGNLEKLNGFRWGLIIRSLDLTGEEGFISAGDL